MRYGSLEDPAAKLQRAAEHYLLIKDALGGRDHQLIRMRMVSSTDGLRYDFFAADIPPLPANLPLMLGDAYHNLRATLDYLVYQLHERHYRANIPPNVADKTQFPIRTQVPTSGTDQWASIRHLGKRERIAIDWLQPYKQRNDSLYGIREHLDDISRMNNFDKHHKLHVARSLAQAVPTMESLSEYGLRHNPAFGVPIESNSLIDTWIFDQKPPEATMSKDWKFGSGAVFEIDGRRIDLIPHLGGSIHAVARVIERFSHLFPALVVPLDLSLVRPVEALP